MKLALAQLNPTIGDLCGNAQQILAVARQAAAEEVDLVLTPELSLCGYPPRDLLLHPSFIAAIAIRLEQLAQDLPPQIAVLVGMVEPNPRSLQAGGKPLFNSMALLKQGRVQQIFHKRLLPTYDVFDEARYFEPGDEANCFVLEVEGSGATVRVGVTICEDLWNDEAFWGKRSYAVNPIADLAQQGTDLMVNLSASPYTVGKQSLREAMLCHSAQRYQQPLVYVNQVGANDDLIFDGCSVAFNRQGQMVCRARGFETDLVLLEFDPQLGDLRPGAIAPQPAAEAAEIWAALTLGVGDYARKCGFTQAVIGLSGGIDSALVAAIAAAALGPGQVLGVLMPSPYSSDHSIEDALVLAKHLGIRTHTLPIEPLMQGYDQTLEALFAGTAPGITEENLQSRIRGNLLMAIANKFGHLLLSTGNKSEMAVGYCTLYGDMNGGLAAIADVPKTKVYEICHWLNSDLTGRTFELQQCQQLQRKIQQPAAIVIPPHILTKAPSAELKPGQLDQDSLPDYDILDDILSQLIHDRQSPAAIVAAGHEEATVRRVAQLVARAEFKRRQAPPGLKITDRAFGTGWRMPIASKWVGYW
ncbi:NAD synthetase [Neosynechococcus sphagnicola sy1]|uniref:Glutamine-dependent NAD(+) synthetase n=1 Tax=Neosynechococcus sphagnicola sy1 TaxID=1497020 RepID=A0A098TQK1_9CYAN|nr:NAD+ synthase [Neosynechococcus sphagnicola]KGF73098.1 NAD synthetase [Neosynechococcus sphagnicola sy1]